MSSLAFISRKIVLTFLLWPVSVLFEFVTSSDSKCIFLSSGFITDLFAWTCPLQSLIQLPETVEHASWRLDLVYFLLFYIVDYFL